MERVLTVSAAFPVLRIARFISRLYPTATLPKSMLAAVAMAGAAAGADVTVAVIEPEIVPEENSTARPM